MYTCVCTRYIRERRNSSLGQAILVTYGFLRINDTPFIVLLEIDPGLVEAPLCHVSAAKSDHAWPKESRWGTWRGRVSKCMSSDLH